MDYSLSWNITFGWEMIVRNKHSSFIARVPMKSLKLFTSAECMKTFFTTVINTNMIKSRLGVGNYKSLLS